LPIDAEWIRFDEAVLSSLPSSPGVYEIGEYSKNPIFYGHGILAEKLKEHFEKMQSDSGYCFTQWKATWFRYEETDSLEQAEEREKALKHEHWMNFGYDPPCQKTG
jgi:hypothetical protein